MGKVGEETNVVQPSDSLDGQSERHNLAAQDKSSVAPVNSGPVNSGPVNSNPVNSASVNLSPVNSDLVDSDSVDSALVSAQKTLAIDIGGSGVKVLLLDGTGEPVSERDRLKTPKPATPEAVVDVIMQLVDRQEKDFDRVSVGFPGVVRRGVIYTAVNLHDTWVEYALAQVLETKLGKPVRVANDADIQGMGAISGEGVEMVITLGTGFGTALFVDGHLVPNLEFGHQRFRKGETYEEQLGRAALKKVGTKTWNHRLEKAIQALAHGFNFDRLYLGGGEVKHIKMDLPENVTVVPNVLGLIGGIKLWQ
ncbi:MAG: ROK family protein [Phormidesmis sp.]